MIIKGEFVNIKLTYQTTTGKYGKVNPTNVFSSLESWSQGLMAMQNHLGLKFEGRLHSGIDDCRNLESFFQPKSLKRTILSRNIWFVMKSLVDRGAELNKNGMTKK